MAIELTVLSIVDSWRKTKGVFSVASSSDIPVSDWGFASFVLRKLGESILRRPKAAEGDRDGVEDVERRTWLLLPPGWPALVLEAEEPISNLLIM